MSIFTEKARFFIDRAKGYAFGSSFKELTLDAVLMAVSEDIEVYTLLADCLGVPPETIRSTFSTSNKAQPCYEELPLAKPVQTLLNNAAQFAKQVPDLSHPGLISIHHLVCALALSADVGTRMAVSSITYSAALALLKDLEEMGERTPGLDELIHYLRNMRTVLMERVVGQDHAVHAFIEGWFNAEITASADTERRAPCAVFVFAGPPGVGKTYLAELGAKELRRPFRRFDMSAYSGVHQNEELIGIAKNYQGAHPGALTGFVEKNPNAVLLFDEIEKAHINTIHIFLQLLDYGMLEDKYYEENITFRDTIIIFTTNVGHRLYDHPNESGVHAANADFHRKTILDALEKEKNPLTGEPRFPAAICSRMSTGYLVLFNRLGIHELERIVSDELQRVGTLLRRQYFKEITFDERIPLALILREGGRADARRLRAQTESFVKGELLKFCELFRIDRLEEVLDQVDRIEFDFHMELKDMAPSVRELFDPQESPCILLVTGSDLSDIYQEYLPNVRWLAANRKEEVLQILGIEEVDLVLLDLWLGSPGANTSESMRFFDHVPAAAKGLVNGQELLHKIHKRLPQIPVYLLSLVPSSDKDDRHASVDNELFMACVRGGGARGMIVSRFIDGMVKDWKIHRDQMAQVLKESCLRLHRENAAVRLATAGNVVGFDTMPRVDEAERKLAIQLRNFKISRAVAAADVGEVLSDVERPETRFSDLIGAETAKEEMEFYIDFLKNPRRFAALGLRPPKGILLHGPPGTGKTMLARAMAGESDVAFIPTTATNFVTIWQGSGPQNVRDLFARARRYAPAIIFIDEIDAIGRIRTGGPGGGRASEDTLNALLGEIDGFTSPSPDRPVFLLAATNFKVDMRNGETPERTTRTLDPALVRRFSRTILVDLPERASREQYLASRLANRPNCAVGQEIIRLIAERSSGLSIAALEIIIDTAARQAAKQNEPLTDRLLEEAFESTQFGDARARTREEVQRTARHEAGHTILYWLSGRYPSYVTVVSRGGYGGYMAGAATDIEGKGVQTRDELLTDVRVRLGGRAAELIYYGEEAGQSTGISEDLDQATSIARAMVCRYGMSQHFGLISAPEFMKYEEALASPLYIKINDAVSKIITEEMDNSMSLLMKNRVKMEAVAKALLQKERLTGEELKKILK